jgi:hypothetical protein
LAAKWGAVGKVESLAKHRSSYVETSMFSDTVVSSGLHAWASTDLSESRRSIDLELLSGTMPRTELPLSARAPAEQATNACDRDEISLLTDPSSGHGTHMNVCSKSSPSDVET